MNDKKKIIIFGLGKVYKTFVDVVDYLKVEIVALSDNNVKLQGTFVYGIQVVRPEEINRYDFDYLLVTCMYYESIRRQLIGLGIKEECILNFFNIYQRLDEQVDFQVVDLLKNNLSLSTGYGSELKEIHKFEEKNCFLNAKIFINAVCDKKIRSLEEVEFQVYSQFGEDGIIQWLIHNVEIAEKTFIEFGVENYMESNTRFLMMNNNWSGLVIDGDEENIDYLKRWEHFWKYDLQAVAEFITKDNINQIITDAGFSGDIGILSIDVDGNDYWILNAIHCVQPRILICEYNNIYGNEAMVSVPYDAAFFRTEKHYSNLYYGASIAAFRDWAEKNNYYYMGSNSAGHNAFFVRKDCIKRDMVPLNANVFVQRKYRESSGKNGELTFLRRDEELKCIQGMKLVDLKADRVDTIANIYNL